MLYRIAAKENPIRRFQHFIESSDWEDRYLCNRRIDKMCLAIIIISLLYFLPVLVSILQR